MFGREDNLYYALPSESGTDRAEAMKKIYASVRLWLDKTATRMVDYAERKGGGYRPKIGDQVLVLSDLQRASAVRTIKAKEKLSTKFLG